MIKINFSTHNLIEKSLIGWKEYELEVMRDLVDNVVIICSIENLDPILEKVEINIESQLYGASEEEILNYLIFLDDSINSIGLVG